MAKFKPKNVVVKKKVVVVKKTPKKEIPVKKEEAPVEYPKKVEVKSDVKCCACGEPLAPGQNQVCKKHIRVG